MPVSDRREPRAIVIGCGVAGIALAARLRRDLKYENFVVYEREKSLGGTWYLNTYPGVGCDVDSHLYSFSFNPNPNWSKRFAEQSEILQYLNDTVDKFGIRPHVRLQIEVVEATWNEKESLWRVGLRDLATGHLFHREAEILVSCVGTISIPKNCSIPGHENFKGTIWHSARWNHTEKLRDKSVAVVGNGCSAAQLFPWVAQEAKSAIQFQRSPQWINERPNSYFSPFTKWVFRNVPLANRIYRFYLWKKTDALHNLYASDSPAYVAARGVATEVATKYMKDTAPAKYHDILIPKFPLGCKRRIFDPGYLTALHSPNVELTDEPILAFTETGLKTTKREVDFDYVILSTGFKIQEFLSPITVRGKKGITLNEHWKATRGAQAYKATFVSGFPNFGIVFGPNAFPAHNSVIYTNETQVEYIVKTIFRPMLEGDFTVIEVKEAAENRDANHVQEELSTMVWSGGCTNWNLDENGRNTTNYHGNTWKFWWQLWWPVWKDFNISGGSGRLPLHPGWKYASTTLALCIAAGFLATDGRQRMQQLSQYIRS
ncbi:Protein arginine N-methyltransferase 1 [Elsinoe australis]|uniref:Protein arginine N-methyltransferase 1 n=1 Tax=Elsinoe australis TaxID=40998 RepID=A0A2P7YMR5_9PEZI|nr:Protein arginine N-methyltransferase 1 [Elsinoe australis]